MFLMNTFLVSVVFFSLGEESGKIAAGKMKAIFWEMVHDLKLSSASCVAISRLTDLKMKGTMLKKILK